MTSNSSHDIEANKRIVQEYFTCMGRGDIDGAMSFLADDAIWWVPGKWEMSGSFTKAQMLDMLKQGLPFEGPLKYDIQQVTAEANRVAVEFESHGKLKDGRAYDNTYHFLFTLENGKFTRVNEYVDTLYSYRTFIAPAK